MPNQSLRQRQILKMVEQREENNKLKKLVHYVNSMSYVFSVVATGLSYAKVSLAFLLCNVVVPSQSLFYRLQKKLLPVFKTFAVKSMEEHRRMMSPTTTICVDGAWDHKRNGSNCTVFFIDGERDKIIHSELVTKSRARVKGNYYGPSNLMESVGVERGIKFLINNGVKAANYCHDKDNKTRKLFSDNWPSLNELLDRNHTKNAIERRFTKNNTNQCLRGLKDKIIQFFYYLLKKCADVEQMKKYWENMTNHFCGNHDHCPKHKNTCFVWKKKEDNFAISQLNKFILETTPLFDKVSPKHSTQSNESSNSLRAKYTDKDKAWKTSYPIRVFASILQKNSPYRWMYPIMEKIGIPLPQGEAKRRVDSLIEVQNKRIQHQKGQEYNETRKKQRKLRKISNKSVKSVLQYKGKPKSEEIKAKKSPTTGRSRKTKHE